MGIPTISSTSPTDGQSSIDTGIQISITFSEAVTRSTVKDGTVVLTDTETGTPVPVNISFATSDTVVKLFPKKALRPNIGYKVFIAGAADSLPAGSVTSAASSDSLAESYSFVFQTKEELFVPLERVTDRDDINHIAPIREESELAGVNGYIHVYSTTPLAFSSNNGNLSTITITFSESVEDYFDSSLFTIEMFPLDYEDYLGNYDGDGTRKLYAQDADLPITLPTGTWSVDANVVTWTKDAGDTDIHAYDNTFPFNTEIVVTIDSTVKGNSGLTLGADNQFRFTTEIFPLFTTSRAIRLHVGPVLDDYYDDTVNRLIWARGISAWELNAREFSLLAPKRSAREFTIWGAVLDAIEIPALRADILRGTSKQLGDFRVDFSNRGFTQDSGRFATARKKMEAAELRLRAMVSTLGPRTSEVGANASGQSLFRNVRNWDTDTIREFWDKRPIANHGRQRHLRKDIDQGLIKSVYYYQRATGYTHE